MHNDSKIMKVAVHTVFMITLLTGSLVAFGQRKPAGEQLAPAKNLHIDGDLTDWGAELKNEYAAQKLNYEIRNDDQYFFVAVRILDQQRQMQAITQGISFMLNTEGKKKNGPAIVYPVVDRIAFRSTMSAENDNRPEDMRQGALQSVRGIQVMLLGNLPDGLISLDNQYGVRARASIDQDDALCIEMRLPIGLVGSRSALEQARLAYNLKINGRSALVPRQGQIPQAGRMGQGSGSYPGAGSRGGYGGGFGNAAPREETGVWGMIRLAAPEEQPSEKQP